MKDSLLAGYLKARRDFAEFRAEPGETEREWLLRLDVARWVFRLAGLHLAYSLETDGPILTPTHRWEAGPDLTVRSVRLHRVFGPDSRLAAREEAANAA